MSVTLNPRGRVQAVLLIKVQAEHAVAEALSFKVP